MQPALHQHAGTAEGDGLVYSSTDLVHRMNVCVRLAGPSIKSTKGADDVADIGVVDVAIDDIGDDLRIILSLPDLVCSDADSGDIPGPEQRCRIVRGESLTAEGF